ncbi:hypothetical protein PCC7418_0468 [Halothece sp. PCC 7418]|uniref:hypothetical protein n=1 Tax=Halothece sp. (strain PCC 7418) TaxID=65093 RepID=UPI0002A08287|nr:hypothetical protein [Halothece sp. PCC 7418]AFZ42697.1 hypothetical protein PCC7418_0468 [Halothece sp. PCC 7418]
MISRSRLIVATAISFILTSFGSSVLANPNSTRSDHNHSDHSAAITYNNLGDFFVKAITYESGNFFTNRSISEQFQLIFGIGGVKGNGLSSFPENELVRDTQLLDTIYKDYLQQQAGGDAIRTRDLANPYTTSLGSSDYRSLDE